ncbi:MAG: nucleoside triphosphate pyrophosphohydrolase [Candidatus Pacebacteria bacterium]|nr:nucleoside triphosphate pyrophosphohydrolase [Candidatus Paceibacterota bacterium]MCF7857644.1 nucleoside triphosphate pyrophosphohydrolase [Candidatus Paceibacterota bacterium]
MSRVYYNKLIRDHIPDKILANGEECEVRVIEDSQEFEQELLKKITEEAYGLAHTTSREEFLDEYADLMTVLDALMEKYEFSEADISLAIKQNVEKKGLFKKRNFLHWSSGGQYQSNETVRGEQ